MGLSIAEKAISSFTKKMDSPTLVHAKIKPIIFTIFFVFLRLPVATFFNYPFPFLFLDPFTLATFLRFIFFLAVIKVG